MYRSANWLCARSARSANGPVGRVREVFFHYPSWSVRHMMVAENRDGGGTCVLVSPDATCVVHDRHGVQCLFISSERSAMRRVPAAQNVHRGPARLLGALKRFVARRDMRGGSPTVDGMHGFPDVRGYRMYALDGRMTGRVTDLILEDAGWSVLFIEVTTAGGRKVLVPATWISGVSREQRAMHSDLSGSVIRQAPVFRSVGQISALYEVDILSHYGLVPSGA